MNSVTAIIHPVAKSRFHRGFRRFDMGLGITVWNSRLRVEETALANLACARSVARSVFSLVYHHAKPLKGVFRHSSSNSAKA